MNPNVARNVETTPKSGHDHDRGFSRYSGKIKTLDNIWIELRKLQAEASSNNSNVHHNESRANAESTPGGLVSCLPTSNNKQSRNGNSSSRIDCTQLTPIQRKSHQRIISLRSLFANSTKFQKNFQRGVFLSCLIYSEDKILVTLDDNLPTLEIDEDVGTGFQHDFHWLHKVSALWPDTKFLKQQMEKCDSASALHFRLKLLQTVVQMQESLEFPDLGKVYYVPITGSSSSSKDIKDKDSSSSYSTAEDKGSSATFICTVNHLRSTKLISAPNVRWIALDKWKTIKNKSGSGEVYAKLSSSWQSLMLYHQVSSIPLGKGLYLSYFKLVTSVEDLKILVPTKTPSIIPNVKIRNNPQLTREEWDVIADTENEKNHFTESQQIFRQQLDSALKKLFSNLNIDRTSTLNHRFFTTEVVEISSSVTLILLFPPVESSCIIEGQEKNDAEISWMNMNKLMALPIRVFEVIHILAYHNTLGKRLLRLNSLLEGEMVLAQHNRRKAFTSEELSLAQDQLSSLSNLQHQLDHTWKETRWIVEVVKAARCRDSTKGFLTLREFLSRPHPRTYVNATNATPPRPNNKMEKILHLRRIQDQLNLSDSKLRDLPGPSSTSSSIPANPNFNNESSSSLPLIVGKGSSKHFEKLRSTASLFDMADKVDKNKSDLNIDEFIRLGLHLESEDEPPGHYQNLDEIQQKESATEHHHYQNVRPPLPLPQMEMQSELDSFTKHQSSRSKLVRTSKLRENVPGSYFSEPGGLIPLSWTKHRTSLDRSFNTNMSSTSSLGSGDGNETDESSSVNTQMMMGIVSSNVVEVYAAFGEGQGHGTLLRIQINRDTSASQVVHQVVMKSSNGCIGNVNEFCLAAVIGARERVLRTDYRPLRLQPPWDKARLYVRFKNDVTAAVTLEVQLHQQI